MNVKNFGQGSKWLAAIVARKTGPLSYEVELLKTGQVQRRHFDQMIRRAVKEPTEDLGLPTELPNMLDLTPQEPLSVSVSSTPPGVQLPVLPEANGGERRLEPMETEEGNVGEPSPVRLRQSARIGRRPGYLQDYTE